LYYLTLSFIVFPYSHARTHARAPTYARMPRTPTTFLNRNTQVDYHKSLTAFNFFCEQNCHGSINAALDNCKGHSAIDKGMWLIGCTSPGLMVARTTKFYTVRSLNRWALSVKPASSHPPGSCNFELAVRFWEGCVTLR